MDTSAHEHASSAASPVVTGKQRLALWKEAQKKLRGKLDPHEIVKMRKEWEHDPTSSPGGYAVPS